METQRDIAVQQDSDKAIRYNAKLRVGGGYELKHKPSSYGIALKWLLGMRKITYAEFAKRFNGSTAQNLNHYINRVSKERFFDNDIEQMCAILKVDKEYFCDLCNCIERKISE